MVEETDKLVWIPRGPKLQCNRNSNLSCIGSLSFLDIFTYSGIFLSLEIWYCTINLTATTSELKEYYGCKNFHNNPALKGLYLFLCMYMCLSAIQLSYGFPIMRKPSSVLNYDNDLAKIGSDVFAMIPFLVELRCLIDFTFHKTSLDMF